MEDLKKVLDLTAGMGETLLRCGAEISRVEETMHHMADYFAVSEMEIFVITNGIFVTMRHDNQEAHVKIRHIPQVTVNLEKVSDINALSRAVEAGRLTLDEALCQLRAIIRGKKENTLHQIAASGIGSGAFCFLFGGDLFDSAGAFICGFMLWMLFTYINRYKNVSKVLLNMAGSFFVTAGCVCLVWTGLIHHLDKAIIGSIIPMIPGVAFTNGIRDIADGDYISGSIRLLDAMLVVICIAAGVGIALKIFHVGVI